MEDDIYEVLEDFIPSEADKTAEELKVSSGDLVNVITKQPSGWWFVQHEGKLVKYLHAVIFKIQIVQIEQDGYRRITWNQNPKIRRTNS